MSLFIHIRRVCPLTNYKSFAIHLYEFEYTLIRWV